MIIKLLSFIFKIIPFKKEYVLFVKKIFLNYYEPSFLYEGFVKIKDSISNNYIWMYMRKDSYMEKEIFWKGLYGEWEKESLKIWAQLCKESNYILDIGANTGIYSLIAKSQNQTSNVFAVEPINVNFEVLKNNITKNKFNIHADKIALSSEECEGKMYMLKDRLNYMTSVNDNRYEKHPEIAGMSEVVEIKVPVKTYQYLEKKYKIPKVELIKIDVEGHEINVLNGMYDVVKRDKPIILLEIIGEDNATALNTMFQELGYRFISIDEVNKSTVVDGIWDNDHHNFLLCNDKVIEDLRKKDLVE